MTLKKKPQFKKPLETLTDALEELESPNTSPNTSSQSQPNTSPLSNKDYTKEPPRNEVVFSGETSVGQNTSVVQNTSENENNSISPNFAKRAIDKSINLTTYKVNEVMTLIDLGEVNQTSIDNLANVLDGHRTIDFDEEYDIRDELHTMMKMVQAMRASVLTQDNRITQDTTITEVKAVIDSSLRLATMLTKANREIINTDRIKAIESCFLSVIGDMPTEKQKEYVDILEKRMKLAKELIQEIS